MDFQVCQPQKSRVLCHLNTEWWSYWCSCVCSCLHSSCVGCWWLHWQCVCYYWLQCYCKSIRALLNKTILTGTFNSYSKFIHEYMNILGSFITDHNDRLLDVWTKLRNSSHPGKGISPLNFVHNNISRSLTLIVVMSTLTHSDTSILFHSSHRWQQLGGGLSCHPVNRNKRTL